MSKFTFEIEKLLVLSNDKAGPKSLTEVGFNGRQPNMIFELGSDHSKMGRELLFLMKNFRFVLDAFKN